MVIPIFEIKLSKKPIAIIKLGDRNISFVKINKYNSKYFTTKDGQTYELDDEYEYRFKKTGIYFYNFSNSKPLSLTAINEIDNVMKDLGESELFNKDRFMSSVGNDPSIDVSTLNIPKDISADMTPATRRFLQDHSTDDETSKTDMMINVHTQKKPVQKYSSPLLGIGMNRTGFAFVQIGYQRIDIVPMYVNESGGTSKAYTQYGVFEVNKDNVYFLKKQMLCFFIISDKRDEITPPMDKSPYKVMKTMVKKKRWNQLDSFIEPIPKNGMLKDIPNLEKKKHELPRSVSISSEKKLVQYQADSPSVCYTTFKELHLTKEAVANKLADPLKKAIPIVLIFGGLMGFVMLLSNLPPIIDTVADRVSGKPDVFVMTPEEYEQWEIDNGLREEHERRYVTNLAPEHLEKYKAAMGGTLPDTEVPLFLGVPLDEVIEDRQNKDTYLGVETDPTEAPDTYLGVETDPTEAPETYLGVPLDPDDVPPQESYLGVLLDQPPAIVPPTQLIFEADNTNGMRIELDISVTDDNDVGLIATCNPDVATRKGAILAIGDHEIECHVTDSAGNTTTSLFYITINVRDGVEAVNIIPKIQPMPGQEPPKP